MTGTMMDMPLTISSAICHAARYHAETEIVTAEMDGSASRTDWKTVELRSRKIASALEKLGVTSKQRVGTIAMNNIRHLELYFGISGGGMVCHTINPRLFPEQLVYIINHAEDQVVFLEAPFLPLAAKLADKLPSVKHFVVLGPRNEEQAAAVPGLLFYDELIETGDEHYVWPELDERQPSNLCYTSGTTGNPKGVQYTHRSTLLHSMTISQPDVCCLGARDSMLIVVPMFHVNAWGLPYVSAMTGAKLVLPGFKMNGDSLLNLIHQEECTFAAGVPTIWAGLLGAAEAAGKDMCKLNRTIIGGAACPPSMMAAFNDLGVEVLHGWGMSETSPLGTCNQILQKHKDLSAEDMAELRLAQGRPPYGVEVRVVDDKGAVLDDPETPGDLQIRGHWIMEGYFGQSEDALTDGWFDTGDIATISADGFMVIRDRAKDIIKSGGEWISSVELENIAVAHPSVADAAAIGVPHPKWDERPVLLVKAAEGSEPTEAEILAHYEGKIASWQVPDRVILVDDIVRNATGKIPKQDLRKTYADLLAG